MKCVVPTVNHEVADDVYRDCIGRDFDGHVLTVEDEVWFAVDLALGRLIPEQLRGELA